MKTLSIKAIDIRAKEWFDKANGNSYFSAIVAAGDVTIKLPFQYGYGTHYIHEAGKALVKAGVIPGMDERTALWRYCEENNITLTTNKQENCKKSEVKAFVA